MWRQGDVLIIPIAELPKDAEVIQEGGDIILAHGEVTGHNHKIRSDKTRLLKSPSAEQLVDAAQYVLRAPQEREQPTQTRGFLHLPEPAALTHEEHGAIELPAGNFKIVIQREYVPTERSTIQNSNNPWSGGWRSVVD